MSLSLQKGPVHECTLIFSGGLRSHNDRARFLKGLIANFVGTSSRNTTGKNLLLKFEVSNIFYEGSFVPN